MLRRARLDFKHRYNRRTYIVSSGDAFSARKAAEFEREVSRDQQYNDNYAPSEKGLESKKSSGTQYYGSSHESAISGSPSPSTSPSPSSYSIVTVPRARKVHQSLLTAPLSTLQCLWSCLRVLQGRWTADQAWTRSPTTQTHDPSTTTTSNSATAADYPGIILTNGPGTAVCIIAAARILRALNSFLPPRCLPWLGIRARSSRDCTTTDRYLRTVFIESWARVTTLSLSGKVVLPVADRFLVQWEGLQGRLGALGGRTEYAGTLIG